MDGSSDAVSVERATLEFAAVDYLSEREAVVIGFGDFTLTPAQVAYATGRREVLYSEAAD